MIFHFPEKCEKSNPDYMPRKKTINLTRIARIKENEELYLSHLAWQRFGPSFSGYTNFLNLIKKNYLSLKL